MAEFATTAAVRQHDQSMSARSQRRVARGVEPIRAGVPVGRRGRARVPHGDGNLVLAGGRHAHDADALRGAGQRGAQQSHQENQWVLNRHRLT